MRWLLIKLIHVYRYLLSPWVGNQCRFYPTCSHYAEEAIKTHGCIKGGYLTLRRLLKCHPWHEGGIDLVPEPTCKHHRTSDTHTHSPKPNGSN
ncbi:membrane protein insertion efficiency factor YidD [Marinimicrobium alkaliphilum]|uniref:membrane protein insertion efficiency factor YidD n=1 Tax=Marinimicrobium alkaliphilum TaxID=2202654 RepID=UPI000DBA900F|nr:membrane protein insertion efficiency factor YidD [Marinimicrobium alkaliphilum]